MLLLYFNVFDVRQFLPRHFPTLHWPHPKPHSHSLFWGCSSAGYPLETKLFSRLSTSREPPTFVRVTGRRSCDDLTTSVLSLVRGYSQISPLSGWFLYRIQCSGYVP